MNKQEVKVIDSMYFEFKKTCDNHKLINQIGMGNIFAISGGRVEHLDTGIIMPVSNGYSVWVNLAWDDTYTVSRIYKRGLKLFIKGTVEGVYAENIGEVAYVASCFVNREFGKKVAA